MVAVIGISARNLDLGTDVLTAQTQIRGPALKAGQPVILTGRDGVTVR